METTKVSPLSSQTGARRLGVALVVASMIGGASAAHAQEPGVVYEPGSPSDKEYSIPLDEARRDAGGDIRGSLESRAFGIGLSRRGGEGARAPRGERGRAGEGRAAQGRGGSAGQGRRSRSGDFRERLANAEAPGAPAFWRLAPLLLVLLPGLLVGLLLARRGPQQPAT